MSAFRYIIVVGSDDPRPLVPGTLLAPPLAALQAALAQEGLAAPQYLLLPPTAALVPHARRLVLILRRPVLDVELAQVYSKLLQEWKAHRTG